MAALGDSGFDEARAEGAKGAHPAARRWVRPVAFAALVAAIIAAEAAFGFSSKLAGSGFAEQLQAMRDENAALAVVVYVVVTVAGCVLLALPGALFAVVAAVLFGPVMGALWCVLAATIGAMLSFLAGCFFLRDAVRPRAMKHELLRRWLFSGSQRNAVITLAVTRLVPVFPFNVQNFAYGATDVPFATYAVCSFLFMVPGTALYTFATAGVVDAEHRAVYLATAVALLAVVAVTAWVLRRRWLGEGEG